MIAGILNALRATHMLFDTLEASGNHLVSGSFSALVCVYLIHCEARTQTLADAPTARCPFLRARLPCVCISGHDGAVSDAQVSDYARAVPPRVLFRTPLVRGTRAHGRLWSGPRRGRHTRARQRAGGDHDGEIESTMSMTHGSKSVNDLFLMAMLRCLELWAEFPGRTA